MPSRRRIQNLIVYSLFGMILLFSRYGLAASSLVPETGAVDSLVHSPITADDLKPAECTALDLQNVITGSGVFQGTEANDLVLGSAAGDEIDGLSGDDCVVGGSGNDDLSGGTNLSALTVLDQFNAVSFANNDGAASWSGDWQETGEDDGPQTGDVSVEIPAGPGQTTVYPDQDTYIEENHPDSNYGSARFGKVKGRSGDNKRVLYYFDLAAIPAGTTILSAALYTYNRTVLDSPVYVHRVTDEWSETGATWNTSASAFHPAPEASFTPAINHQYYAIDITPLVQQWVSGTYSNFGLMLIASPEAAESRYSSREEAGTAEDPYLTYITMPGASAQALRLQNAARGAWREVDLSTAQSAQLHFDYLRQGLDDAADYASLEVSADGGVTWVELGRFSGPASDTLYQTADFDITGFRAGNTRIRFLGSPTLGVDDRVYFDNIQIAFTAGPSAGTGDILLGGAGDDTLDGGDGMDTCYGGQGSNQFLNCETIFDP